MRDRHKGSGALPRSSGWLCGGRFRIPRPSGGGVRAAVEGFLELSVDAESIERCAETGEELDDGVVADRAGVVGCLTGHQKGAGWPCWAMFGGESLSR